jgi:hypothetical protein
MIDLRVAVRTTLLLVDDDIQQLDQFWTTKNSEPILAVAPEKKLEAYGMLAAAVMRKDATAR